MDVKGPSVYLGFLDCTSFLLFYIFFRWRRDNPSNINTVLLSRVVLNHTHQRHPEICCKLQQNDQLPAAAHTKLDDCTRMHNIRRQILFHRKLWQKKVWQTALDMTHNLQHRTCHMYTLQHIVCSHTNWSLQSISYPSNVGINGDAKKVDLVYKHGDHAWLTDL